MKKILFICLFWSVLSPSIKAQQLEYFISKGIDSNPLLNEYRNQTITSKMDSLLVKAMNMPQVISNTQILYSPSIGKFGYDNAVTNGGNYASIVDASQPIFNRNLLKNRYEGINLQQQTSQNNAKISKGDLQRVITNLYLTAYADYLEVGVNRSYLVLMNEYKEIVRKLSMSGMYRQSDWMSLTIEIQSAEIDLKRQLAQLDKDASILRQLCGIVDTTQFIPELPPLKLEKQTGVSDSPLFMKFKIDSLRIINTREETNLKYLPKVSWYAGAGLMSSTPSLIYRKLGFSVGANMSIPVFDGHQRKLEHKKLDIQENTRAVYEEYFKNQYSEQMMQLIKELQSTRQITEMVKKQLSDTEKLGLVLKNQLNNGNVFIIELINTMKNYISVSRGINQLQVREFEIINELNYLMLK